MTDYRNDWMWSEACEMLSRAERMHRAFFRPTRTAARRPTWEPPADALETDLAVLVFIALPGVDPDRVEAVIEDGCLLVAGLRILPAELQTATIHRLELPQGRFERRVRLPAGRYAHVRRSMANGCLLITLEKGTTRG